MGGVTPDRPSPVRPVEVPARKVHPMSDQSRRRFLTHTSIGAAAVSAAFVAPSLTGSADAATPAAHPLDSGPAHEGSFTVWIKDAKAGQIVVMAGESEVTYTDRSLAKRLARIAARAKS
jgi:hypothetical protein